MLPYVINTNTHINNHLYNDTYAPEYGALMEKQKLI